MRLPSFTFAAADPGKDNWHNKGRNTMEAAQALKVECEAKGMRCTPPKLIHIEYEEAEVPQKMSAR